MSVLDQYSHGNWYTVCHSINSFSIVYKNIDEWFIEWQGVVQRVTTNQNEWYNEWQRVVQRGTTNDSEW